MIILPAIDIQGGRCVRLYQGDFDTVHQVAHDPLATAVGFCEAGAQWVHMVDLDGARTGKPANREIFLTVAKESGLQVELGGGIRDMATIDDYLQNGIARIVLGTAAIKKPDLVRQAAAKYGRRIAVGIDAKDGQVMVEGWLDAGNQDYLTLAKEVAKLGIGAIIFTDITRDGALTGPNLDQLKALREHVACPVIASGGIKEMADIAALIGLDIYGAICGKSIYEGTLDLQAAIQLVNSSDPGVEEKDIAAGPCFVAPDFAIDDYFRKAPLIPAIVVEAGSGEVLMLAYMSKESLAKTVETGYTWFYSRSRQELWHKGATSGHYQRVIAITGDCDQDALLLQVEQMGPACHTGRHSCFYNRIV